MKPEDSIRAVAISHIRDSTDGIDRSIMEALNELVRDMVRDPERSEYVRRSSFVDSLTKLDTVLSAAWVHVPMPANQVHLEQAAGDDQYQRRLSDLVRQYTSGSSDQSVYDGPVLLTHISAKEDSQLAAAIILVDAGNDEYSGLVLISQRPLARVELLALDTAVHASMYGKTSEFRLADPERIEDQDIAGLIGLVAHELRTPLTGLRGNVQLALMSNRKGKHERVPDRLDAAIEGVDAMSALVQALLDVSRIERGVFQFQMTTDDLRKTVESAVESLAEFSIERSRFRFVDSPAVILTHDRECLRLALAHILRTVAGYAIDDGMIEITLGTEPRQIELQIGYRGKRLSAIDENALTRSIYTGVKRVAGVERDELRLDLAFSRGVIARHGGEIAFASENNGGAHMIGIHLSAA